jgi:hypothetical protein
MSVKLDREGVSNEYTTRFGIAENTASEIDLRLPALTPPVQGDNIGAAGGNALLTETAPETANLTAVEAEAWLIPGVPFAGKWTIWRVPVEGGQPAQFLDEFGVGSPDVSPDGQWLAYRKTNLETKQAHIVIRPISLEGPVKMLELPPTAGGLVRWLPNGQGVCFNDDRTGASEIWVQPITGGPAKQLTNFQSENIFWFSWSRDGKHLAVTRGSKVSDVVMISKLR